MVKNSSSEPVNVAFQGANGAYSEKALMSYFKQNAISVPCHTFYDVVDLVKNGKVKYGILPVENSIVGCITHSYDLLLESQVSVVGEQILPICHCLLGLEKQKLSSIKQIFSHPSALAQCEVFLRKFRDAEILATYDTAGSADIIKNKAMENTAIIASEDCAELYGLSVLQSGIEDFPNNQTRYVIVENQDSIKHQDCYLYKTSIVFDTLDQPGMLNKCLGVFEEHSVNLSFLESRPHKTAPWKYHFFADLTGYQHDANLASALDALKKHTDFLHIIGSYPKFTDSLEQPARTRQKKAAIDTNAPLYSIERHPKPTKVAIGDCQVGSKQFIIMAGPCSVEGRRQLMETAKFSKDYGAQILRGGAFKPRSSPYSFQGLKEEGLKLLKEASEEYGMPFITEVMSVDTLELVAKYADALQIGARNMQNFVLLTEVGKLKKPVLLKRGMMATLKELLLSAEYILEKGNPNVILCERGIRTFETATRNTLDLSAVPWLKERSHLPVIVDPSHGTGVMSLIKPMAIAALAVGADGLMIETHVSPSTALSDGPQSMDAKQFKQLMSEVKSAAKHFHRTL